jgi:hypothetical protein
MSIRGTTVTLLQHHAVSALPASTVDEHVARTLRLLQFAAATFERPEFINPHCSCRVARSAPSAGVDAPRRQSSDPRLDMRLRHRKRASTGIDNAALLSSSVATPICTAFLLRLLPILHVYDALTAVIIPPTLRKARSVFNMAAADDDEDTGTAGRARATHFNDSVTPISASNVAAEDAGVAQTTPSARSLFMSPSTVRPPRPSPPGEGGPSSSEDRRSSLASERSIEDSTDGLPPFVEPSDPMTDTSMAAAPAPSRRGRERARVFVKATEFGVTAGATSSNYKHTQTNHILSYFCL